MTSVVTKAITLNPIMFATLTSFGLIVKGVASVKKYDRKTENANFARVEYKKILDAVRFYLRGESFNEKNFLDRLKMVDDFTTDHCREIPAKVSAQYHVSRCCPPLIESLFRTALGC